MEIPQGMKSAAIFGPQNCYLDRVLSAVGKTVKVTQIRQELYIDGGNGKQRRQTRNVINALINMSKGGVEITNGILTDVMKSVLGNRREGMAANQNDINSAIDLTGAFNDPVLTMKNGVKVAPLNESQQEYARKIQTSDVVFGIGPAGTGKTYLAVAFAVHAMQNDPNIEKIVITRPVVEAGEKLGFLPGSMKEKIDPYMQPIYDALEELMDPRQVEALIASKKIEIVPLAFMRGRTLKNAIMILDEAQNTTPGQMKMFVTRPGKNSRIIVTGDESQNDLPPGAKSGLTDILERIRWKNPESVAVLKFAPADVERSKVAACMVGLYEEEESKLPAPAPG